MSARALCVLILLVSLTACGGGASSASPRTFTQSFSSMSGNWQMTLTWMNTIGVTKTKTQSGFLVISNGAVSGTVLFTDIPCSQSGSVAGTVNDNQVTLSVAGPGLSVALNGTPSSSLASMSGDYTISASPCGSSEVGTWKASLVQPVTGSFQGLFTSNETGLTFPVTAQVNQGPNTGASNANISGSLAITGSPCFTLANISGLISGTTVVMTLLDSNGNPMGNLDGTASLDGTQLVNGNISITNGNYRIQQQAPHTPCSAGDAGAATLTL